MRKGIQAHQARQVRLIRNLEHVAAYVRQGEAADVVRAERSALTAATQDVETALVAWEESLQQGDLERQRWRALALSERDQFRIKAELRSAAAELEERVTAAAAAAAGARLDQAHQLERQAYRKAAAQRMERALHALTDRRIRDWFL